MEFDCIKKYLCDKIHKNVVKNIASGKKPTKKIYKNVYPKKGGIRI